MPVLFVVLKLGCRHDQRVSPFPIMSISKLLKFLCTRYMPDFGRDKSLSKGPRKDAPCVPAETRSNRGLVA